MDVSALLAASRAAHVRYRSLHDTSKNSALAEMRAAIQEARDGLSAAHGLDPRHADPAWQIPVFEGQPTSAADLAQFYESYLAAH